MRKKKLCDKIIEDHYAAIFRFCNARLMEDHHGAEECTQEVFLLFLQKKNELDLSDQIDKWLIAAASRITKKYVRKKAEQAAHETSGAENLPDETAEIVERASLFDALTEEEYGLLLRYYSIGKELRKELASELGISVNTLYQRIFVIKGKMRSCR